MFFLKNRWPSWKDPSYQSVLERPTFYEWCGTMGGGKNYLLGLVKICKVGGPARKEMF
jgi:hypothetical protein